MLPSLNRIQGSQHIRKDPGYRINDGGHTNILTLDKIVSILAALTLGWDASLHLSLDIHDQPGLAAQEESFWGGLDQG